MAVTSIFRIDIIAASARLASAPPAAIADDRVPVAVGLLLGVGGDLEREGLALLEGRAAVETETGNAGDRFW
jgi:hypothetical protein